MNENCNQSYLNQTLFDIQCAKGKQLETLKYFLNKYSKMLNDLNFKQNHLQSQMNEIQQMQQHQLSKHQKRQQKLSEEIETRMKFVTLQDLRNCLSNKNDWNRSVGYFLNPLAAFEAFITKLQIEKPSQQEQINQILSDCECKKQTLLKYSEKKLIVLQRLLDLEDRINQVTEQENMINQDISGRHEQICIAVFEYEELEQVVNSVGNQTKPIFEIFSQRKQVQEAQQQYKNFMIEIAQKQEQLKDLQNMKDSIDNELNQMRIMLNKNNKFLISSNASPIFDFYDVDKIFDYILEISMEPMKTDKNDKASLTQVRLEQFISMVMALKILIHEAIKILLDSTFSLEQKQALFSDNYDKIVKKMNEYRVIISQINDYKLGNLIKQLEDAHIYSKLLYFSKKESSNLLNELNDKNKSFFQIITCKKDIQNKTFQHININSQILQLEKEISKIQYQLAMVQCSFQRAEQSINQLKIQLQGKEDLRKWDKIVERMFQIEALKTKNNKLIKTELPHQLTLLKNSEIQLHASLKQLAPELLYLIEMEKTQLEELSFQFQGLLGKHMQQYNKIINSLLFDQPQLLLSQTQNKNDELKCLQTEFESNQLQWIKTETEYKKEIKTMEMKLNQIVEDSSSKYFINQLLEIINDKVSKISSALKQFKQSSTKEENYGQTILNMSNININKIEDDSCQFSIIGDNKENRVSNKSKNISFISQNETSILGTIAIDISQPIKNKQSQTQQWSTSTKPKKTLAKQRSKSYYNIPKQTPPQIDPQKLKKNLKRSSSSISNQHPQPIEILSPKQKYIKRTRLFLQNRNGSSIKQSASQQSSHQSSQVSQNNPILSPQQSNVSSKAMLQLPNESSIKRQIEGQFEPTDKNVGEVEVEVSIPVDKSFYFSFKEGQKSQPEAEDTFEPLDEVKNFKVYKKLGTSKILRRYSVSGPPESYGYQNRILRINTKKKGVEFFKADNRTLDYIVNNVKEIVQGFNSKGNVFNLTKIFQQMENIFSCF